MLNTKISRDFRERNDNDAKPPTVQANE